MRMKRVCTVHVVGVLLGTLMLGGCGVLGDAATSGPADQAIYKGFSDSPRIRYGTYPCAVIGTPYLGRELGPHAYHWSPFEKDGIVYTCGAGHVDIIHVRIAADWTAYLIAESYKHLMKGDSQFSYKLAVDRSRNFVHIAYPKGWGSMPAKTRSAVAREIAFAMGPYLTYTTVTWHEMLTWYGFKCIGLPVEFASAFSWEDSYSNLLGTILEKLGDRRAAADQYRAALSLARGFEPAQSALSKIR